MPAELKQVSAKLASFPAGSGGSVHPHVQRVLAVWKGESCQGVWKGLFTCGFIFQPRTEQKLSCFFLTEHSREILLLSLLC